MKKTYYLTTLKETSSQNENRWWDVAQNTGNLVFYNAIQEVLNIDTITSDQVLENNENIENLITADLIWIEENTEYNEIIEFYQKIKHKIKLIPLCLGLHTGKRDGKFEFGKGVIAFLSELSEQVTLACRGEFTVGMLNQNGIKNVTILGCPSLYYPRDENFTLFKPSKLPINPRISTNCTLYPNKYSPKKKLKEFIGFSQKNQAIYIEQTNFDWIENLADSELEKEEYQKWQMEMKYFFTFNEWFKYMNQFDFVLGNRFHGNVMGILTGIPALVFVHDYRIQEMCNYFKIPTIEMKDFDSKKPLAYWYEKADFTNFNKVYKSRYQKFRDYLKDYGIFID